MFFKTIIQGRLDFGTDKSYEKVVKMFQYRVETYYKNALIFKQEELFKDDEFALEIPRYVGNVSEKAYKNTVDLLEYCAQFALTGVIRTWLLDSGTILQFSVIEPGSDKAAVQLYLKGKTLVKEEGKQDEAYEELTKAIEKFDRHAQAYERRAKICFILQKYADAIRDYTKSINIDPMMPSAYLGRARVYIHQEKYEEAIADIDQAIKKSVALESIHWKSRRLKAYCHLKLNESAKAAFELKLYANRAFKEDDPNIQWQRWSLFQYAVTLMDAGNYLEALEALLKVEKMPQYQDGISQAEYLRVRGQVKKMAGKNGYVKDLKEAAELGDPRAKAILKEG